MAHGWLHFTPLGLGLAEAPTDAFLDARDSWQTGGGEAVKEVKCWLVMEVEVGCDGDLIRRGDRRKAKVTCLSYSS